MAKDLNKAPQLDRVEPVESSAAPVPKVVAAGVTGSLVTVLVAIATAYGVEVSPEVAAALTTLLSLGAGYLAPRV